MSIFVCRPTRGGFSLVEVVVALGIVSFSVLATVGLLSVGNDTNRKARDEMLAAQLTENEFSRIRSLSAANFPINGYISRYFDANLGDLGPDPHPAATYHFSIDVFPSPAPSPRPAVMMFNAHVRYPANAPQANQQAIHFTTAMSVPTP